MQQYKEICIWTPILKQPPPNPTQKKEYNIDHECKKK
jgi:hypothetical protein